ncbi:MAG: BACON domain-containing protein, partial [Bacteroidales bacterium]|nr:BACON domain-containing protein [Bacteroidales bacterium]
RYNVDYEISVPAKWIRRVTTKAPLYEKEETFLLEENEDPEARTGTISFTSSGHPDASLTVTVSQGGKDPILKNTKPGLYGLDGMNYVLGADGWNQNSRKKEADGSLRFRLLNAQSLSVATLSGIREEASCNLHALLQSRDKTLLDNDYPASLIYTKDGLGWFKVNDQTFFIINF